MNTIQLSQGKSAIVDDGDFAWASKFQWHWVDHGKIGYARRTLVLPSGRKSVSYLHKEIFIAPNGFEVDHISGDSLDNRRSNLRVVTHAQNQFNRGSNKNNTSGFKGVYWCKPRSKWKAEINFQRRRIGIGLFSDILEAAEAYAETSKKLFAEFSRKVDTP